MSGSDSTTIGTPPGERRRRPHGAGGAGLAAGSAVLARTREAFVALDLDGLVAGWNPAAQAACGWRAEEVLGRAAEEVLVPDRHREAFAARMAAYRLMAEDPGFEDHAGETALVLRAAGGLEVRMAGPTGVVTDADGRPCLFALLQEIGAEVAADADLAEHLERLEAQELAAEPQRSPLPGDLSSSLVARRVLAFARELLDLDVLWISRFEGPDLVLALVDGSTDLLGGDVGDRVPLASSFCARIADGRLPGAVADVSAEPGTAGLPAAAVEAFGAFLGVPLRTADGRDHGTLCGACRGVRPEFGQDEVALLDALAETLADVVDAAEAGVAARRAEQEMQAIGALVAALDARDGCTVDHSRSVVALSLAVALEMGLTQQQEEEVAHVALLHDVGKLGVPDAVLRKRGALDDRQRRVAQAHAAIGGRIVGRVAAVARLAPAVRAGHERWDGAGYPDGLSGEAIPLSSRIVFACEAWDAMTSDRPYRDALNDHEARRELRDGAGTQFDPGVVEALEAVLRRWR